MKISFEKFNISINFVTIEVLLHRKLLFFILSKVLFQNSLIDLILNWSNVIWFWFDIITRVMASWNHFINSSVWWYSEFSQNLANKQINRFKIHQKNLIQNKQINPKQYQLITQYNKFSNEFYGQNSLLVGHTFGYYSATGKNIKSETFFSVRFITVCYTENH